MLTCICTGAVWKFFLLVRDERSATVSNGSVVLLYVGAEKKY